MLAKRLEYVENKFYLAKNTTRFNVLTMTIFTYLFQAACYLFS